MATLLFLVQLLFIGTLIVPAYTQMEICNLLPNATASNFTVSVTPKAYKANTTYLVTISDNRNLTDSKNVTKYLLQALSPQNASMGEWKVVDRIDCGSTDTAVLNATRKAANWTSPDSNVSSVEIRAYIIFTDESSEFKTMTLNKESEPTTASPATTPNSVSMVQSSSFFIAVIQLPLLLVTSKLLS
ncbi:uncharacterized protein LJ206_018766 [Theristicus caerulescens]